jgi:A/G-specific adenine glycosylase
MEKRLLVDTLINWYQNNKRDLPWRNTQNPYFIWLSEVILQQTRVKQGLPYYEKFISNYPTISDLADAEEQAVLRLWQGLGYYSRARNLHQTAKQVVADYQGVFPDNYQDLLKLKGIGKYTAAAIASFAFGEAVAVLDGNVYRVIARLFGIETDIASTKADKEFRAIVQSLIPQEQASIFNQAIMEFGALQCTPQKPNCMYCPFQTDCLAFNQGKQGELPVKNQKIKVKKRYFHYLIFDTIEGLAMQQRQKKDIWEGLYDFFLIETQEDFLNTEDLLHHIEFPNFDTNFVLEKESEILQHVLTHQKIFAKFWHFKVNSEFSKWLESKANLSFYSLEEIQKLPKPILIANYLQKHFF